jgi:hypothetical protein
MIVGDGEWLRVEMTGVFRRRGVTGRRSKTNSDLGASASSPDITGYDETAGGGDASRR